MTILGVELLQSLHRFGVCTEGAANGKSDDGVTQRDSFLSIKQIYNPASVSI